MNACWKIIGTRGDRSCSELATHSHCRNCPVYGKQAAQLLDRNVNVEDMAEATISLARPIASRESGHTSILIFRLGTERLAFRTTVLDQIAPCVPIRTLPHRRGGAVLGLVNLRGELVLCVSLANLIGAAKAPVSQGLAVQRLIVLSDRGGRTAFPADEVIGVNRYSDAELIPLPDTMEGIAVYSIGLLNRSRQMIAVLDEQLVLKSLTRSVA